MFNYLGNGGFPAESPALSHINVFCEIDFGNVIIVLGGGERNGKVQESEIINDVSSLSTG